jgi:hypothetical protein
MKSRKKRSVTVTYTLEYSKMPGRGMTTQIKLLHQRFIVCRPTPCSTGCGGSPAGLPVQFHVPMTQVADRVATCLKRPFFFTRFCKSALGIPSSLPDNAKTSLARIPKHVTISVCHP